MIVTGGRGFIGRRLLGPLVANGASVSALVRSGHDRGLLGAAGARVSVAAIRPGPKLVNALAGHDVLINLAYDMRAGMAENVETFDALIGAAKTAGIQRVVHVSSAVVYDAWPDGTITENSPMSETRNSSYRDAKLHMENSLLDSELQAAILQPTIVYGTGSALWTVAPMAALAGGGVVLPDPIGSCAAVHVDDVVQAAVLAADLTGLQKERFLISGAAPVPWDAFYEGYRNILGHGTIIRKPAAELMDALGESSSVLTSSGPSIAARISASLRRIVGNRRFEQIRDIAAGLPGRGGPAWPDRHMMALYSANPSVSIEKARSVLGYDPQFDFQRGLAQIAANKG